MPADRAAQTVHVPGRLHDGLGLPQGRRDAAQQVTHADGAAAAPIVEQRGGDTADAHGGLAVVDGVAKRRTSSSSASRPDPTSRWHRSRRAGPGQAPARKAS